MDRPQRKRNRLRGYDYSQNGAYFVTVCTKNKQCLLSTISVGKAALCLPELRLTDTGCIVERYIQNIEKVYAGVTVDTFVIMPNHIHMILRLDRGGRQGAAFPTISDIVRSIKIMVRKETGCSLFQTSFHDHIIRDERDYHMIWQYIDQNPIKWELDRFYVNESTT